MLYFSHQQEGWRTLKQIGLFVHSGRADAPAYAHKVVEALRCAGASVWAEEDAAHYLHVPPLAQAAQLDALISLGGDGTLLRAMQEAVRLNAPLLGINLGRVGFLTEVEPENMTDAITALMGGSYTLEDRRLLRVELLGTAERFLALNDVVVSRGGYARLITLDALAGDEVVGHYVADGLIVATPTGSTGYSLSAGGPVIHPAVDCMVITPICAHSLQHRPVVVPGDECIRLALRHGEEDGVVVQVDGQTRCCLHPGEILQIQKAEEVVHLVRLSSPRFFPLVREKLTEWTR